MSECEFQKFVAPLQSEFDAHVVAVRFDRAGADEQLAADLTAGFVFRQQLQDSTFHRRQPGQPRQSFSQIGRAHV